MSKVWRNEATISDIELLQYRSYIGRADAIRDLLLDAGFNLDAPYETIKDEYNRCTIYRQECEYRDPAPKPTPVKLIRNMSRSPLVPRKADNPSPPKPVRVAMMIEHSGERVIELD